jgi:O-antigen/teichoic acid export membrane protein
MWSFYFAKNLKQMGEFLFYFIIICCASFLILATVSPDFIRILTPSVYHRATSLVGIVLIAQVMATISNYFLSTFFIAKKVQVVAFASAICAIVNIAFNLILIPQMGIMDAAIATLISYGMMAGILFNQSQRLIRININFQPILITGIISVVLWYLLSKVALLNPWHSLTVKTLLLTPIVVFLVTWLHKSRKISTLASGMPG